MARHSHAHRRSLPFLAGSAVAQLGVLAALWAFAPPLADPGDELSADRIYQLQVALDAIAEKQAAAADAVGKEAIAEAVPENREGSTGTRSKDEDGTMGSPTARATEIRYGAAGPADRASPHLRRQATLEDAAEFGMLGALNAGAGVGRAPWGRDADSVAARGNTWGDDFGAGGIGLSGIGEGGGGSSAPSGGRSGRALAKLPGATRSGARGVVPEATREVVSDVGARYAPVVGVPAGKALGVRADLERGRLAPGGGPFHLRLALQSTATAAEARPHLSVHLVLDISGSMAGESMSQARKAAAALVDKLAPSDDFSFTTFSTDAAVRVPDGLVGPRREAIKRVIAEIQAEGGTNIGEGLI